MRFLYSRCGYQCAQKHRAQRYGAEHGWPAQLSLLATTIIISRLPRVVQKLAIAVTKGSRGFKMLNYMDCQVCGVSMVSGAGELGAGQGTHQNT